MTGFQIYLLNFKICYNFTSSMIFFKIKEGAMNIIDYEKYSFMNRRQLLNSLENAEKKEQKLKAEMEKNKCNKRAD